MKVNGHAFLLLGLYARMCTVDVAEPKISICFQRVWIVVCTYALIFSKNLQNLACVICHGLGSVPMDQN